jgi:hypothetical protein
MAGGGGGGRVLVAGGGWLGFLVGTFGIWSEVARGGEDDERVGEETGPLAVCAGCASGVNTQVSVALARYGSHTQA